MDLVVSKEEDEPEENDRVKSVNTETPSEFQKTEKMKEKHWCSREVAEWLSISKKLLFRMVNRGEIPAVRITKPGRNSTLRFPVDDLMAWYDTRKINQPQQNAAAPPEAAAERAPAEQLEQAVDNKPAKRGPKKSKVAK